MICYCNGKPHTWDEDCPEEPVDELDYEERKKREWEENMTDRQCLEWQKARDAGVD